MSHAGDKLGSGDEIAGYKEPDPPEGTHRYVVMLFRQQDDERTTVCFQRHQLIA